MHTPIHWGILAPGRIARKFAADLRQVPGNELWAVASRSIERARAFAEEFGARRAFGNYADLMRCEEIDVVYVASPHSEHMVHTIGCLDHGRAVLCEKPIALNAEQTRRMVEVARQRGVFLMEALWTRFIPAFDAALGMAAAGRLGKIEYLEADFGFEAPFQPQSRLFDPALGGGALLDIGIYPVFAALSFMGPASVEQVRASLAPTSVDTAMDIILRHEGGGTSRLQCSLLERTPTTCLVRGERGSLQLESRFHETTTLTIDLLGSSPESTYFPRRGFGYTYEIQAVATALTEGLTEHPLLPLDDSLQRMTLLDEIRRKAGVRYPVEGG